MIALFSEYLECAYYPYFRDYKDKALFELTLEQNVHTTLENDLIAIYPSLSGNSVRQETKETFVNNCGIGPVHPGHEKTEVAS